MSTGPLAGVRVLDFTRVVSGPSSTLVMADLGADVIKIERPGTGDDARQFGPPYVAGTDPPELEATYFSGFNRGKKSVVLDLATDEGRAAAAELATESDVLVENFRPGFMERCGLGADTLMSANPRLIYCSITGFGAGGPYRDRAAYDLAVSAIGGMMSITGEPGRPPVKTGVAVLDVASGLYAFGAVAAALYERERTGRGRRVEISMLEVQVAGLINGASAYLLAGEVMGPQGTEHPSIVPYQGFEASDGWVIVGALNDPMFVRFSEAAGHPEWPRDARFASNPVRVVNRLALVELIGEVIRTRTIDEWVALLGAAGVAVAPVNTIDRVFSDPQVVASGIVREFDDPRLGRLRAVVSPIRLDGALPEVPGHVPALGEHTGEVLGT